MIGIEVTCSPLEALDSISRIYAASRLTSAQIQMANIWLRNNGDILIACAKENENIRRDILALIEKNDKWIENILCRKTEEKDMDILRQFLECRTNLVKYYSKIRIDK